MKNFFIIIIFLSSSVYGEVINIGNKELKQLIKEGIPIVDVRTKDEWEKTGVISKSNLISMVDHNGKYSIENWLTNFTKLKLVNKSVVLICAVGGRSYYLSKLLNRYDEKIKIYNLKNGLKNWIRFKNPIVRYNAN